MEENSKSKSLIKTQIDEEDSSTNIKLNIKGNQISFSQTSAISDDNKENQKFFSPVSNNN